MYVEAKNVLNERYCLYTTKVEYIFTAYYFRLALHEMDAQSWFQLSSAALHVGDKELAQLSYMRAWQFGESTAASLYV